MHRGGN